MTRNIKIFIWGNKTKNRKNYLLQNFFTKKCVLIFMYFTVNEYNKIVIKI